MVQLRLPANSRIRTGKNWPKSDRATRTKTFKVYRLNPRATLSQPDRSGLALVAE